MHNLKKIKTNKKAAIELSIGTIVIIVIAMTMLIMGIVLVRNIFAGATDSVDTLNQKVKGEITSLFAEEDTKVAIRLGADKTAKIKQGERTGIAIGAEAGSGIASSTNLRYYLELLPNTNDPQCQTSFKNYFVDYNFAGGLRAGPSSFEDIDGPNGFSIIVFEIPDTAKTCEQRIRVEVIDSS
ncbi:MAG: hypothetical protein KJ858_04355, partial [Nanoarchaeota archaeon]|nr:hypothetical protein [Nanoarchaeota archaeon]